MSLLHDVRDREVAERALSESEARYRSLVQTAGSVIVAVSRDGLIEEWNREAERISGWSRHEVLGLQYVELFIPETEREAARVDIARVLRGEESRNCENPMVDRAGHVHYMIWNVSPRYAAVGPPVGFLAIGQDITQRKAMEERLSQSEEELRLIIENAPTPIATLDKSGRIVSANRACTEAFGYSESELRALTTDVLTHQDDLATSRELRAQVLHGTLGAYALEKRYVRKDGSVMDALLHVAAVQGPEGRPVKLVAQIEDRTAWLRAKREAQEHRERLAHTHRLHLLGEMAASIAHEINQPLTVIAARTHAARRRIESNRMSPDRLVELLDIVNAQAHRAGEVIRKLRALVKKHESAWKLVDLNALVRDTVELAELDAILHDATIRLDLEPALKSVIADEIQIQQVLLNLLRNAIDATDAVGRRGAEIVVSTRQAARDDVEVAVADEGTGIKAGAAEQLFDPFYSTKEDGMGMGLSISRSLIGVHRGRLSFEPGDAGGTVFRFTLPAALEENND